MIYIVDASVAVKWFVEEDYSDRADELLDDFSNGYVELVAPKTLMLEFCNAIRKYVVRGHLKGDLATSYVKKMSEVPLDFVEIDWKIVKKAYSEALELGITVYDAIYVVIAEEKNGVIITADDRLYRQLKKHTKITHIKDYQK